MAFGAEQVLEAIELLDDGEELYQLLGYRYLECMGLAFDDVSKELVLDLAFVLDNPHVQDVLTELGHRIVGISDTTKANIQNLVGKQAAEGWSVAQLADEIEKLGMETPRAVTIARTETAHAYTQGTLIAYEQASVTKIRWVASAGACDFCLGLAGKVVELGKEFAPGIKGPPAHANCRCTIIAVLE